MPLLLATLGSSAEPAAGASAPPLSLRSVLARQQTSPLTWSALRGSAVVIEFWATWCSGCRAQIAHLNSLERAFRGRPLKFLSITDEDPALVSRFLKDYPMSGWIGIDLDGKTQQAYGVTGLPRTVLVDAKGVVRHMGDPSQLTTALLEDLVSGRPLAVAAESAAKPQLQIVPEPFFQMMLRPAAPASATGFSPGAVSGTRGRVWSTWGVPLANLLSEAYDVPVERINSVSGVALDALTHFDVSLTAPELTDSARRELLRQLVETTFRLKVRKAPRDLAVLLLRRDGTHRLQPSSGASSHWEEPGKLTGIAATASDLAHRLGLALGGIVVNETEIAGRYDFKLHWDARSPGALNEAVRAQLGLVLEPGRRSFDHLIVEALTMPASW